MTTITLIDGRSMIETDTVSAAELADAFTRGETVTVYPIASTEETTYELPGGGTASHGDTSASDCHRLTREGVLGFYDDEDDAA